MTQVDLAGKAGMSRSCVAMYERTGHLAPQRLAALRTALEVAGASFIEGAVQVQSAPAETISGLQCRQARALLGWSQRRLQSVAGVVDSQISSFERRGQKLMRSDYERAQVLRIALEAAGVVFTNGDEPGVKLRRP